MDSIKSQYFGIADCKFTVKFGKYKMEKLLWRSSIKVKIIKSSMYSHKLLRKGFRVTDYNFSVKFHKFLEKYFNVGKEVKILSSSKLYSLFRVFLTLCRIQNHERGHGEEAVSF